MQNQAFSDSSLADIAYTLQVGREAMEERLAVIVGSIKELEEKLQSFVEDKEGISDLYRGQVKGNKETMNIFADDEEFYETICKWLQRGKYLKLIQLWVKGLNLHWDKLYVDHKPFRISLPTYPFAKERYWIPGGGTNTSNDNISTVIPAALHPMLHQNTSNLSEQRFSSTFTGREFFLVDYVVKGQKVLPGVAYLEMAYEAIRQAANSIGEQIGIRLKNVTWVHPLTVGNQPVQAHIGLYPEENGEITYEVYSESEEGSVVHSQGSAVLHSVTEVPTLNLTDLQKQCNQTTFSSSQCYEAFQTMGIDYGPAHQGIEKVYVGEKQVLAKLSLPSCVSNIQNQFVLHPTLMNSALQISIAFINQSNKVTSFNPFLPFVLDEVEVLGKSTSSTWVLIRSNEENARADEVHKLDIDLCDEQGNVCVRMKGIEFKIEVENAIQISIEECTDVQVPQTQENYEVMTFEECWEEQVLLETSSIKGKTLVCFLSNLEKQQALLQTMKMLDSQTKIIFISSGMIYQKESQQNYSVVKTKRSTYEEAFKNIVQDHGKVEAVLYLWPLEDRSYIEDYSCIFHILQTIASTKLKPKRVLLGAEFENGLDRCYLESWIGFERSIGFVLPNTQVSLIYQEAEGETGVIREWMMKLWAELQTQKVQSVLYQKGKRYVSQIKPTVVESGKGIVKTGGTYLITGGLGGLGFLFAEHLAKTQSVNLILNGRSMLSAEKQEKIKALEALGSQVLYVQADICDMSGMKEGINRAKERFGSIHGVIHAAGIVGSPNILEKEYSSFQKVLDPKIQGTLILDELLRGEQIDFICYFSSAVANLGDFGSCDYAIGNRFQMAYAHYRNHVQQLDGQQNNTFVINWPLWKDGGMNISDDEHTTKMYLQSSGQRSLETEEGLKLFDQILGQNRIQNLVLVGQTSRMMEFLGSLITKSSTSVNSNHFGKGKRAEMKGLNIEQCLEWDLKEHISQLLKIPRNRLDLEENLSDFGFDSISLAEFAKLLTNYYGIDIKPALFFDYSTIRKLIQFFYQEHSEVVQEFYHVDNVKEKVIPDVPKKSVLSKYKRQGRTARFLVRDESKTIPEPIAIIGMSGRFPQARNINEMWKILTEGKDVVQEIPPERFDWQKYYSNSGEPGKTNGKWCGSIPGVDEFDPLFFEISPREAKSMDPRQRLLLQESWKALEDAGYGEKQIKNSQIGMFVGVEDGDYQRFAEDNGNVTSNHNAILAARLSYFLNLNGPNMAINTACSSGLVAAHQACMSLRNHECDTAIAAGVNLIFTPESYIGMSEVGMLSSDGKCFAFDKRANGMVPGEAVVAVVLKRLSQAEADGDPIYAVIPGSGINYDGKTNGITAPSGASQTNLLKSVYDQYQINPEEIEYIVTHGTGTKLGDPIEINALYNAFKDYTEKQGYCAITSTKTNFGHTLAASGLVSLVSLVQAFRHKIIPASLHCKQENDYINWKESPFYVNKANKLWPEKNEEKRMGAISAFGMSGTNAHMVLQSYNEEVDTSFKAPYYLLAFSAKSQEALQEKIKDMMSVLQDKERQVDLSQISYTLLEGRHHFTHRCAVVIQDQEDAMYVLNQMKNRERLPNLFRGKVSRDFKGQKVIEEYAQDLIKKSHSLQDNQNKYKDILYALADLYCQGYEIPWEQLFGNIKIRRIGLPTYPFVGEQYWTSKSNKARDERIPLQTNERKTKPVIAQQSLQPKTTNTNLSKNTNKPSGIILSALSDYQIVKSQPTNKPEQSIILKLPEMPLLQSKKNNKSKTYIQSAFSLESLQKELVMSLAEILYIEHSNIDIDRQFIDMGMDSIIGVEW
ncbi:hypothetical protein IEE_05053, partial [Bacillus cereus BAG5X1-1]